MSSESSQENQVSQTRKVLSPLDPNVMSTFLNATQEEREDLLSQAVDITSFADPYVVMSWHVNNIACAAQNWPHLDSLGNNDPRTVDHLETFLFQQPGAQRYDIFVFFPSTCPFSMPPQKRNDSEKEGVIRFTTLDTANQGLRELVRLFPWVGPGHPSHPAVAGAPSYSTGSHSGDVVVSVTTVSAPGKGQLESAGYYALST